MNHLLTGEGNGDTSYNRLINRELGEIIKDVEPNEDFRKIITEVKTLIDKKEGISNPKELKKRIYEIIYKNKNKLPSFEYFSESLKANLYCKHKHMGLNQEWGENEVEKNIEICLNQCLTTNRLSDNFIKEIIIFEIMRQGYEFKRKNEESLNICKNDTAGKIVHTLDIENNENNE